MTTKEEVLKNLMSAMLIFRSIPEAKTFSGLTRGECAILTMLYKVNREVTSGEISSALKLGTGHVANSLKSLEAKKLILRKENQEDKRKIQVSLTEEGYALISEKMNDMKEDFYSFIDSCGEERMLAFSKECLDIMKLLEQKNSNNKEDRKKDA